VVVPSMPGYGFSGKPAATGWDTARMARAWVELMKRLGYTRFVAQGGDWGALVTDVRVRRRRRSCSASTPTCPAHFPPEVSKALASNVLGAGDPPPSGLSADEQRAYERMSFFYTKGIGYALEMGLRPQTLYGLADSPVALAAWMIDHDAWSYDDIARAFVDGQPVDNLTRDEVLDNITLYWLTNTGVSSGRLYWENKLGFFDVKGVSVPAAVSVFPNELPGPTELGRAGLPQPHLLQRSRQGQPLRRLARAGPLHDPAASRVQVTALIGASVTTEIAMSSTVETTSEIRPFDVDIPDEELAELRRRIALVRWPSRELVTDRSQGVQLATIQELARYWASDYDLRRIEARLNALPQFTTEIDGVDIHFIHVKSPHADALPLIMTHGWPGSVIELLDVVGPLTDPTAHSGRAEDAFTLVLPSLPGYGFSGEPTEVGWDPGRTAQAWAELMSRLGYTRYVAQGGDVGASVTDAMGRQAPQGLVGIHMNLLVTVLAGTQPTESDQERAAADALATFRTSGFGYFLEQATRPQTIGYALLDSPVAMAAWMLDHDTDSYYKISRAFLDGQPAGNLTRDHIVDNITLYWLTGTGASAARSYWESGRAAALAAGQTPPEVSLPVGFTTFPGEIWRSPRSWVEQAYPNLTYFNEVDKGGHFAAWEEPELFSSEVRAAFRSLR
jgi:pimeloyl-ACP methyl ester carboxylesterase